MAKNVRYQQSALACADDQPILSPAERHLYAALISDLPTLLPACKTWEDYLWAHVLSIMEGRLEKRWNDLGGFWQNEEVILGQDDGDGVSGTLDEVFAAISHSGSDEAK